MATTSSLLRYSAVAALVGLVLASIGTDISLPCPPSTAEGNGNCVSFQKVVLHPVALMHNSQGSLSRFGTVFLIGFAVTLIGLLIFGKVRPMRVRIR